MAFVWLNGQFVDEATAAVGVRDTGLLHAAGVFTTMRAARGKVFRLGEHLKRLRRSCEELFIPLQYKDATISSGVDELLQRNTLTDARLRITITRGASSQDPLHGLRLEPTALITAAPMEAYPEEFYRRGMTVIVLDSQKANPYDVQAGHKTLNYFSRLTALRSANHRGAGEALWFNVHNYLQCGSISNVFLVKNGELITPPTNDELADSAVAAAMPYPRSTVLPGITRGAIIEIANREKVVVKLSAITVNELLEADEVFLTNSIMSVMPVCRIEKHAVGADRPGDLTQRLAGWYAGEVDAEIDGQ